MDSGLDAGDVRGRPQHSSATYQHHQHLELDPGHDFDPDNSYYEDTHRHRGREPQHPHDYQFDSSDPTFHHHLTTRRHSPPNYSPDLQFDDDTTVATNARHHEFNAVNPDDFYKNYRGGLPYGSPPDSLPMAPSSIPRPSLRPNGDSNNPRPAPVSSNRTLPRSTNIRAASNPVDNRSGAVPPKSTPSGKPSVKDLKKRFDQNQNQSQNGDASTSSSARAHVRPTAATQQGMSSTSNVPIPGSYSAVRGSSADQSSHSGGSSRSQRSKYVAEDQVSNNVRSFASRVGNPRGQSGANPNHGFASTKPTSRNPSQPTTLASTPSAPPQGLLFGEILPEQCDTSALGFGIDSLRPRGASESGGSWMHQRTLSDPELEPPPNEDWHTGELGIADSNSQFDSRGISQRRERSFSDAAPDNAHAQGTRKSRGASLDPDSTTHDATPPASRLPISQRAIGNQNDSLSVESTRQNSPTALKRQPVNGRGSRAVTPTSRARTPTSRSKTPTRGALGQDEAPPALPTPNSSSRLQAYVEPPAAKQSPTLRSSRPRQPVAMATTASSRMKAVEKSSKVPTPTRSRASSRAPEPEANRRRKISVGPIDFEQRREHIRLAYSKSLRESQALEARKRAAERRRKELEAAAKAKAAVASAHGEFPSSPLAMSSPNPDESESAEKRHDVHDALNIINPIDDPREDTVRGLPPPDPDAQSPGLTPTTSLQTELPPAKPGRQSLTLGVPGSFPAFTPPLDSEEAPPSAISVTTETTEFDDEIQDNSPLPPGSPNDGPITIAKPPSPTLPLTPVQPKAEYQYPFEEDPDTPEQPKTGQHTIRPPPNVPSSPDHDGFPVIPGAFGDDHEGDILISTPVDPRYESTAAMLPSGAYEPVADPVRDNGNRETIPFPRMQMADESDCQSEYDDDLRDFIDGLLHKQQDAATDACTEDTDDQGRTDDCQSESHFGDNMSSKRASSCVSVDADLDADTNYPTNTQNTSASNDFLMPPSRPKRLSQHSQWTDLTVDSPNPSNPAASPNLHRGESPTFGHVTIYGSSVIGRESDPTETRVAQGRLSVDSRASSSQLNHQQLPQVDMGENFQISYISQQSSVSPHLPSPRYRPPPVPPSASSSVPASRRTSSLFHEHPHHGNSMMDSGRGSIDVIPQMETPQTIDSNALDTPADQYFGLASHDSEAKVQPTKDGELTDKERHRLIQRRNVIKELVDTEAVFVRDMNIVEEIYKGTAEACPKLDSKVIKQIFRNSDEIIAFHTQFLGQIKEAVSGIYVMRSDRASERDEGDGGSKPETSNTLDRAVLLGQVFKDNTEKMKSAHEGFLRSSDQAAKKLIQIQQDPTVKVWLNECNEVAKELTAAWDLDSLLIKPMQRITKYPNLIITLLQHTPNDHPDREELMSAKDVLETAIIEINKTKKNFELVGQIVGRKRKDSDVKGGFARAFGKRVDKLQATGNRPPEDPEYAKLNEKFGDDYLRLQVVLRDVEFYTRQVSAHVREFLQYLSSVELVMRLQPGSYPELESKWVQFNISIRDLEKVALEEHLGLVRKHVIEPFELVIKAYGNPSLAMKKRQKRRLDYERMEQLRHSGRSADSRLQELVEHYEALNDTLKKELPKLSALTEKVGNICLANFVQIQVKWFGIWKDKMRTVVSDCPDTPDLEEVVSTFQRDFPYVEEQLSSIGILNPAPPSRPSQSTAASGEDALSKKTRSPRPSDVDTMRSSALSSSGDLAPSLPTPDFLRHNSGSLSISPTALKQPNVPSPHQYNYRDYYAGINPQSSTPSSSATPDMTGSSRSLAGTGIGANSTRPSTGRSFESGGVPRQSLDSTSQHRRDSYSTYHSAHPPQENKRFSGLFHSALPMPEGPEESRRSSRASSRERGPANDGYNVLWLAASLFEFNIATTKHEAGYPYLIYQAGEIFDVIAEKGELWLAKNQDDPAQQVGWIWSKHFAKLADS